MNENSIMTCDELIEMLDLYAIGALEKADAELVRAHLDTGCEQCGPRFIRALMQAADVSVAAPLVEPPVGLRSRIAASVGAATNVSVMPLRRPRFAIAPWLLAAASLAALAVGFVYEENARRTQADTLAAAVADSNKAKGEVEHTAALLAILQSPTTKQVAFNIDKANLPHGTLYIHQEFGVAMIVAHLPAAPSGFKYETWVVPKAGAPRPIEAFNTDQQGSAFTVVKGPIDLSQMAAVAVSIEPADSTPVKPTKVLFASPV